jgi:hypothetical protein
VELMLRTTPSKEREHNQFAISSKVHTNKKSSSA